MHSEDSTLEQRVHGVSVLVPNGKRGTLGIAGAPGAGKTTFSTSLTDFIEERVAAGLVGVGVVQVPVDGFHLADAEMAKLGRSNRRGAADTFDVAGCVSLLERMAAAQDEIVCAPSFDRILEQPKETSVQSRSPAVTANQPATLTPRPLVSRKLIDMPRSSHRLPTTDGRATDAERPAPTATQPNCSNS